MVSTENRAILSAFVAVGVGLVVFAAVELTVGVPGGWTNFLSFLFFIVLGFVVPQLYLSRTDTSVSPLTRLRVVVILTLVLGAMFSANATRQESGAILVTTVIIVGVVVAMEVRDGYIATIREEAS